MNYMIFAEEISHSEEDGSNYVISWTEFAKTGEWTSAIVFGQRTPGKGTRTHCSMGQELWKGQQNVRVSSPE